MIERNFVRVWQPASPLPFKIDRLEFRLVPTSISRMERSVQPVSFLAPQISTSPAQVSYADVNRSVETPQAQNDFSGGLARKQEYDSSSHNQFLWSKGIDTSGPPGTIYPQPTITTIGAVISKKPTKAVLKQTGVIYVACQEDLYQIQNSTTITLDKSFADPITDLIIWNDKLVVAFGEGSGTNMQYRVADTVAGAFSDMGREGEFLAIVQNNPIGPVLYNSKDFTIVGSADVTAPWVEFTIGDQSSAISSLTSYKNSLIVGKERGPWLFTSDYIAYPLSDKTLEIEDYITVCKAAINWHGLYIFTGKHSTYSYDGDGITSIGLDLLADPQVPGGAYRPDAFTADPHFLYAMVAESTSPSVQGGVYIWKTADGGKTWHNYLYRSDLGQGSGLLLATNKLGSTEVNAVLFAYKSGGNWQVAWSPWPSTVDPRKDSAYTFDATNEVSLRTLDHTANLPTHRKNTGRLKIVADHLAENTAEVEVWSRLDDEDAVLLHRYRRSPSEEQNLVQREEYYRMSLELRMTGAATDAATVQQIHGYEFPARYLSRVVRRHVVPLLVSDGQPFTTGGFPNPTGSVSHISRWRSIMDALRSKRRDEAAVDVVDETGRSWSAYLEDITEQTVQPADGGEPVFVASVTLLEVET